MFCPSTTNINPTHVNNIFGDYSGAYLYQKSPSVQTIEQMLLHLSEFSGGSKGKGKKSNSKIKEADRLKEILETIGLFSSSMTKNIRTFLGNPMGLGNSEQVEDILFYMMFTIIKMNRTILGEVFAPELDIMAEVLDDIEDIEYDEDDYDDYSEKLSFSYVAEQIIKKRFIDGLASLTELEIAAQK